MGSAFLLVVILAVFGGLSPAGAQHAEVRPALDVVIRNGRVLDGAGHPWTRADVVVFDLDTTLGRATREDPTLLPEGIERVLVNGVVVIEPCGRRMGSLPGQTLHDPGTGPRP
jgi:N-acyl-D-aspartate/D-glutamate deacylase